MIALQPSFFNGFSLLSFHSKMSPFFGLNRKQNMIPHWRICASLRFIHSFFAQDMRIRRLDLGCQCLTHLHLARQGRQLRYFLQCFPLLSHSFVPERPYCVCWLEQQFVVFAILGLIPTTSKSPLRHIVVGWNLA